MQQITTIRDSAIVLQAFIKDLNRQKKPAQYNQQISISRLSIIQHLADKGPQTLKSLADYRKVSAATMSCLVTSMVADGWVLRANSRQDRRSKIFIVTRKGKTIVDESTEREQALLEGVIKNLTDQEQLILNQSVQLVQKVINSYKENPV